MTESYGKRFKEVRKFLKLTQAEFAKLFGLSPSHISNIETEKDKPSEMLILFIASKFNINEDWLRSGNGAMSLNWDYTDEGLINKYNHMKMSFEDSFKRYTGKTLRSYIKAYSRFVSLISTAHLDNPELIAEYLELTEAIIADIELFIVKADDLRLFKTKKQDYEMLLDYKVQSDKQLELINKNLKDAANLYLRHHKMELEL